MVDMTVTTAEGARSAHRIVSKPNVSQSPPIRAPFTSAPSSFPATSELLFSQSLNFFCGKNVSRVLDVTAPSCRSNAPRFANSETVNASCGNRGIPT
jgi:hypothetical protein